MAWVAADGTVEGRVFFARDHCGPALWCVLLKGLVFFVGLHLNERRLTLSTTLTILRRYIDDGRPPHFPTLTLDTKHQLSPPTEVGNVLPMFVDTSTLQPGPPLLWLL